MSENRYLAVSRYLKIFNDNAIIIFELFFQERKSTFWWKLISYGNWSFALQIDLTYWSLCEGSFAEHFSQTDFPNRF